MENFLQLLGASGIGGIIIAVANAIFNRRKMGADTTKIIEEAATSAVNRTEADNGRLREQLREIEDRHRREVGEVERRHQQEIRSFREEHRIDRENDRHENEQLWRKARECEQEVAIVTNILRDYVGYARRLAAQVRRLGGQVEDPPELPESLTGPKRALPSRAEQGTQHHSPNYGDD